MPLDTAPSTPPGLPPGCAWREFADGAAQADALAQIVAQDLRAALAVRETASLIVAGGKSPAPFFQSLSRAELDWARVRVSLADERWVPVGAPDTNEELVRGNLLRNAAVAAELVPLLTPAADASDALPERTEALRALARPFDVVVLGMGEDGHFASLFPGAEGLADALRADAAPALVAMTPPAALHRRISMNLAALLDARHIYLSIQGTGKRAALERALRDNRPMELPVSALLKQMRTPVNVFWSR